MPATPSTMIPLGAAMPAFSLPNTNPAHGGQTVSNAHATGSPTLVMFLCNHCPFVKLVADELADIGRRYTPEGLAIIAVSSNDADTHPDDAPDKMTAEAEARGYTFPYLYDESQSVARSFDAACTPDFFLYTAEHTLAYRGQLDDARPGNGVPVTGKDLRAAIDAVLAGRAPDDDQTPSIGCGIKWKA